MEPLTDARFVSIIINQPFTTHTSQSKYHPTTTGQGGLQKFTGWRGPMLTDSGAPLLR